jgi:GTP cyclohydrolase IA
MDLAKMEQGVRLLKVVCLECDRPFWRITNTHLWKEHRMTCEEYLNKYPGALIEDPKISLARQDSRKGKAYDELFEADEVAVQREVRKIAATEQMKDPLQREVRGELCGYVHTEEQRLLCSERMTKHGGTNYRERALKFYGEECMRCGSTKDLAVHHKDGRNFNNEFGNHSLDNLVVLCNVCHSKQHTGKSASFVGISLVEKGAIYLLKGLQQEYGLDLSAVDFTDTPKRVARAYGEIFEGIDAGEEIKSILSTTFPTTYDGMVVLRDIRAFSMCPHHLLPVIYKISVGYIPTAGGLGLSKIPRLAVLMAKSLKLQETFTKDLADTLNDTIKALGVMVYVEGDHMCMHMRGVKTTSTTITSAARGVFLKSEPGKSPKEEFLRSIGK